MNTENTLTKQACFESIYNRNLESQPHQLAVQRFFSIALNSNASLYDSVIPTDKIPALDYLTGGTNRLKIDLSGLTETEQQQCINWLKSGSSSKKELTASAFMPRAFASHAIEEGLELKRPIPVKQAVTTKVANDRFGVHYGCDLALGPNNPELGTSGHLYLHVHGTHLLMGFESAGPGKSNPQNGNTHTALSAFNSKEPFTPFMEAQMDTAAQQTKDINQYQDYKRSSGERYNHVCLKPTPEQWEDIQKHYTENKQKSWSELCSTMATKPFANAAQYTDPAQYNSNLDAAGKAMKKARKDTERKKRLKYLYALPTLALIKLRFILLHLNLYVLSVLILWTCITVMRRRPSQLSGAQSGLQQASRVVAVQGPTDDYRVVSHGTLAPPPAVTPQNNVTTAVHPPAELSVKV
jgi:hypothetical protein